jgi:hypothetical protein
MEKTINQRLDDIRNAIMSKEIGDDGWDLRDELLELLEIVAALAQPQLAAPETIIGASRGG